MGRDKFAWEAGDVTVVKAKAPAENIYCRNCAHFTFDVPDDEPGKPIFFKPGVHGLCQGATFHPRHIEHGESIRCVWFVARDKKEGS